MSRSAQSVVPETPEASPEVESVEVIETDSLVEEVSIDGMCGVY